MATILITGCDRGLGEEFALHYAARGVDRVIATCLEPDDFRQRHGDRSNVEAIHLDVTDELAIRDLAARLDGVAIDVLINNAGIPGPHPILEETDLALWRRMLDVNLIAPFVISRAFTGHVTRSERKVIALITSRMGSIGLNNTGQSYAYRSSKAGLNMVMKSLAIDLSPHRICVLGIHPGNVTTDGGPGLTIGESVTRMREIIERSGPHQSGTFYNYDGQILPW
jgi:NAD(P)-dependent dehydrogenase (short-subunit alcohol dehydrogenase family)